MRLAAADVEFTAWPRCQPHIAAAGRVERSCDPLEGVRVFARFDDFRVYVKLQCLRLAAPAPSGTECITRPGGTAVAPEFQSAGTAPHNVARITGFAGVAPQSQIDP